MMRRYRLRYRQELTRLRKIIEQLTINNDYTLHEFEKRIGKKRRVIVEKMDVSGSSSYFAGQVVAFLPAERVSVLIETGELITVDLAAVKRDESYVEISTEWEASVHTGKRRRGQQFIPRSAHW